MCASVKGYFPAKENVKKDMLPPFHCEKEQSTTSKINFGFSFLYLYLFCPC